MNSTTVILRSPKGDVEVGVQLDGINDAQKMDIEQRLESELAVRKNYEAIAATFAFAVTLCPDANHSDLWHHVIYRHYRDLISEQSWKRASGQAFEKFFVDFYNPHLTPGVRLRFAKPDDLRRMGIHRRLGRGKLDIVIEQTKDGGETWEIVGGIHAKVSLAERVTDDEPASRAMMRKGYFSPLVTLDVKSFPPPHGDGVNRGELGTPERPSEKRKYIERHGSFSACFSYNLRTHPSGTVTPSGRRIFTLSFSAHQPDAFVQMIREKCVARCK